MLISLTSYSIALIVIRIMKFRNYADRMYKADFSNPKIVEMVFDQFYGNHIHVLVAWLPICFIIDVVLRKWLLPSVGKPRSVANY